MSVSGETGSAAAQGDLTEALRAQVAEAAGDGIRLRIEGGGTKTFLGRRITGEPLRVGGHRGVVDYAPEELVLTARAGTPLTEIEALLAEHGQMLGFEPPHFGTGATLGGTVAAGLSGPRRPFAGAARDFVLGTRIVNGRGQVLRLGGQVIKNVAGYDLSRLMTGAMGTLGVILEVSLRVLPRSRVELTLAQPADAAEARERLTRWCATPMPLSAACVEADRLYVRLSGADSAVERAREVVGGEPLDDGERFWTELREQRRPFFEDARPLWRISVPPAAAALDLPGDPLMDWAGALRWLKSEAPGERIRAAAEAAGGHAMLFRGGDRAGTVWHPLPEPLMQFHKNIKQAIDPKAILNTGIMYADF